ncbi:hypothetical protein [Thermococcus sp. MAR1]|uniref:hypothetical protein n=1 Tax=Thermococcus sp. MAR1 TaxID=1638263 RepID=UPI00143B0086|nr:hypothetical protein [Thermococcus sp. MAR1]NJE10074.1 hypothetical protein [Thermococcus sp. MAR1]
MGREKKAYVTTVGTSPEAVFNPIWYLAEAYSWIPDEVYLLWNEEVIEELSRVVELVERLSRAYGKEIRVHSEVSLKFDESDPVSFRELALKLVKGLKEKGYEVIVDITPGRKFMSALLLGASLAGGADEVTYLHLEDFRRYLGKLLFEVPMVKQRLFRKKELTGKEGKLEARRREGQSPSRFQVTREDLMALLDSLYLDDVRRFQLKVGNQPIGSVHLGGRARLRINDYIELDKELHGGHTMMKEAIIAGMNTFRNWGELKNTIETLLRSGRPLYIGFDTNALMFRVPSKMLNEEAFYERGNLRFDFVYSDEVALEIGRQVNRKLPYSQGPREYSNQPTPKARLASLALVELERLRSLGVEKANSKRNAQGDTKIALDYKSFAEEKHANVLVVTFDERAYAEMEAVSHSGLLPFRLEWDFSFGMTFECTWEELRDTIYTLAVTLGELNLHYLELHYELHGIWRGKNMEDWKNERLKLSGFEYGRVLEVLR